MKMQIALALTCVVSLAHANDPRIRMEVYDKSVVYNVHTQIGRASLRMVCITAAAASKLVSDGVSMTNSS